MSASVTICLCTYNGAPYLTEQLASLASQRRLPDEVVISDDGSRDGTLDLLERWAASAPTRVLIERRADPVGHVANLQSALRRASSDFVFICDQDDRWSPEKVQRLALVLEDTPEVAGAFCDSALIDGASGPVAGSLWHTLRFGSAEQAAIASGRGLKVLLRRNVVAGHALALRRDRLDLLLPFPSGRTAPPSLPEAGRALPGGSHRQAQSRARKETRPYSTSSCADSTASDLIHSMTGIAPSCRPRSPTR